MNETIDFMTLGAISRTMYFLITILAIWSLARLLDKLSGQDFKKNMRIISNDAKALALYYGFRIFGISYVASTIFS